MGVNGDGRPHGALRWFLAKADMAPARDCEVSLFMSVGSTVFMAAFPVGASPFG